MKKILMLLATIIIMLALFQPILAQPRYEIYVHNSYGGYEEGAQVTVVQGNNEQKGQTNYEGVFYAQIFTDRKCKITAQKFNQYGEYNGYPPSNTNRIDIYMN
jgi:hypothetical protein